MWGIYPLYEYLAPAGREQESEIAIATSAANLEAHSTVASSAEGHSELSRAAGQYAVKANSEPRLESHR